VSASNGIDGWVLPCKGNTPITFTLGEFTVQIPYTAVAMQQMQAAKDSKGNVYCLSAIAYPSGGVATIDQWLFGDSFLTNVYSVFDFGTNAATGGRIGFAQLTNSGYPGGSSGGNSSGGTSGGNSGGNSGGSGSTSSASGQFSSVSKHAIQALVGVAAIAVALL